MKRFSWFIILFLFSSDLLVAQISRIDKTDQFFNSLSEHDLVNGSIAISSGGEIEYLRTIGFARINQGRFEPATVQTKYRIGSVSKMFTAVMILQLSEEDRLSLHETLDTFFPTIPNSEEITVRDMLYHRSGLPNYTEVQDFNSWKNKLKTEDELIEIITEMNPESNQVSRYIYSNSNYLLLSYIIEKISGKSYQQVLNERILTGIGSQNTYFENESDTTRRESRSYSYSMFSWTEQQDDVAVNHSGAGALVSTPVDLIRFIDELFAGNLVSDRSLQEMTSFMGDYGMGMFAFNYSNEVAYGHEGRINEYYTTLIHFPDSDLSIAYVTNGVVYPPNDIINYIARIWLNESFSTPVFNKSDQFSEELIKYVGTYRSDVMSITVISKIIDDHLVIETGGTDFATISYGEHKYANIEYGYFFEFNTEENELVIKEVDNRYILKKINSN